MIEEAIKRAIEGGSMLYNPKQCCPDDERDRELRWIYHLAEIAPDGPAIECGVWAGGTMICWAMARQGRGPLFANDIKFAPEFTENTKRYGLDVYKMEMKASWAGQQMAENSMAFCFIDADHKWGIYYDVITWPDRMMPGGILAFHDYGSFWEQEVKQAVDRWQDEAKWELVGQVGSLIAFRRPDDAIA